MTLSVHIIGCIALSVQELEAGKSHNRIGIIDALRKGSKRARSSISKDEKNIELSVNE
jgi:hypothetical protein